MSIESSSTSPALVLQKTPRTGPIEISSVPLLRRV